MAIYIDPHKFLPVGTSNILKSSGFWDIQNDTEWEELIDYLEGGAVASIEATVNLSNIENESIISELVKNHVTYNLFMPLSHNETYVEQAQISIVRYDDLIDKIRASQLDSGIKSEEIFKQVPGIIIG